MVLGVPQTPYKNINLSGHLTFFKHFLLLPIELPIALPMYCLCIVLYNTIQGSWAGPARVWLGGPRVLGRAGLAFIFRLDTAFIFRLDAAIIFRLDTAIIFRLAILHQFCNTYALFYF